MGHRTTYDPIPTSTEHRHLPRVCPPILSSGLPQGWPSHSLGRGLSLDLWDFSPNEIIMLKFIVIVLFPIFSSFFSFTSLNAKSILCVHVCVYIYQEPLQHGSGPSYWEVWLVLGSRKRARSCVLGMLWCPGELSSCGHSRQSEAASAFPSVAGLIKATRKRLGCLFLPCVQPKLALALDEHLLQIAILGPSWQVTPLTCNFPQNLLPPMVPQLFIPVCACATKIQTSGWKKQHFLPLKKTSQFIHQSIGQDCFRARGLSCWFHEAERSEERRCSFSKTAVTSGTCDKG